MGGWSWLEGTSLRATCALDGDSPFAVEIEIETACANGALFATLYFAATAGAAA